MDLSHIPGEVHADLRDIPQTDGLTTPPPSMLANPESESPTSSISEPDSSLDERIQRLVDLNALPPAEHPPYSVHERIPERLRDVRTSLRRMARERGRIVRRQHLDETMPRGRVSSLTAFFWLYRSWFHELEQRRELVASFLQQNEDAEMEELIDGSEDEDEVFGESSEGEMFGHFHSDSDGLESVMYRFGFDSDATTMFFRVDEIEVYLLNIGQQERAPVRRVARQERILLALMEANGARGRSHSVALTDAQQTEQPVPGQEAAGFHGRIRSFSTTRAQQQGRPLFVMARAARITGAGTITSEQAAAAQPLGRHYVTYQEAVEVGPARAALRELLTRQTTYEEIRNGNLATGTTAGAGPINAEDTAVITALLRQRLIQTAEWLRRAMTRR